MLKKENTSIGVFVLVFSKLFCGVVDVFGGFSWVYLGFCVAFTG